MMKAPSCLMKGLKMHAPFAQGWARNFSSDEGTPNPLPEYLQNTVFGPLRMTKTFVVTDEKEKTPDMAHGYSAFPTPDDYQAFVTGDGGAYSRVDDLYLFDRALYTDELVRQSALTQAFTPAPVLQRSTTYGFGWNIKEESFGDRVWHTGSTGAFRAFIERRLGEPVLFE